MAKQSNTHPTTIHTQTTPVKLQRNKKTPTTDTTPRHRDI